MMATPFAARTAVRTTMAVAVGRVGAFPARSRMSSSSCRRISSGRMVPTTTTTTTTSAKTTTATALSSSLRYSTASSSSLSSLSSFAPNYTWRNTKLAAPSLARISVGGSMNFSSDSSGEQPKQPQPLFLWMGISDDEFDESGESEPNPEPRQRNPRLLLPVQPPADDEFGVLEILLDSPDMITEVVNEHYETEMNFVGGMGESDPGVWFASVHPYLDALNYGELIRDSIDMIKAERHGVPFGVYTTGCGAAMATNLPVEELDVDVVIVSLVAGTPDDYIKATNNVGTKIDFSQVCRFIVEASEMDINVEVALSKQYATNEARELAKSLGARQVHLY